MVSRNLKRGGLALVLLLVACGHVAPAEEDAGSDIAAACGDGVCCTPSGAFAAATTVCSTTTEYRCDGATCGGTAEQRLVNRYCSGDAAACEGNVDAAEWTTALQCSAEELCTTDETSPPTCTACENGCTEGACVGAVCTEGACCTPAGQFADASITCESSTTYRCAGSACGGQPQKRVAERACSGQSAACDGVVTDSGWEDSATCDAAQICAPEANGPPSCLDCENGCEGNGCIAAQCDSGTCCDPTGQFKPSTTVCSTSTTYRCSGQACGGQPQERIARRYCSGSSAACDGANEPGTWRNLAACGANDTCEGSGNTRPVCSTCPSGCDAGTCREARIWIFPTRGQFGGDIGGRVAADNYCAIKYRESFEHLACNQVHALLGISASDRLQSMPVTFGVPTDAPVFRAQDGEGGPLVANSWNELTNPNLSLTTAVSDTPLLFWSGQNTQYTCDSWTSLSGASYGELGDASARNGWLSRALDTCDKVFNLICICWAMHQ